MASAVNEVLTTAAGSGDTPTVLKILREGGGGGATDVGRAAALLEAAKAGHTQSVAALLATGASVNFTGEGGLTGLHWAVLRGHVEVATMLVAGGGADPCASVGGSIPLSLAPNDWTAAAVRAADALRLGQDVAAVGGAGRGGGGVAAVVSSTGSATGGHNAATLNQSKGKGHAYPGAGAPSDDGSDGIEMEEGDGGNSDALLVASNAGVFRAILDNDVDRLQRLLQGGESATEADPVSGDTPLHAAARHARFYHLAILCEAGANPDAANAAGELPLDVAADMMTQNYLVVRTESRAGIEGAVMIPGGKEGNQDGGGGGSGAGGDQDDRVAYGNDLSDAASNGDSQMVAFLLEAGFDANTPGAFGLPALFWASKNGHSAIVTLLLEAGATTEAADAGGFTALHHAAQLGHMVVVADLLTAGANRDATNVTGATPLMLAEDPQIIAMLEDRSFPAAPF